METIDLSAINYLAVLVAALAHIVVGLVWFSRRLFGDAWTRLTGQDLTPDRRWMPVAAVGHVAIALVLAILFGLASVTSILGGLVVAWLVWGAFFVTLEIGELVWEKIPVGLFLLRVGDHFVGLSLAAVILVAWT